MRPGKGRGDQIGRLLTSLSIQSVESPKRPLKVVVVCNNTSDDTASIVRAFVSDSLVMRVVEVDLPQNLAHVGTARRMAMDIGAAWLDERNDGDGVLISTDADARPPSGLVAANLAALANAEIVGRRLVIEDPSRSQISLTHAKWPKRIENLGSEISVFTRLLRHSAQATRSSLAQLSDARLNRLTHGRRDVHRWMKMGDAQFCCGQRGTQVGIIEMPLTIATAKKRRHRTARSRGAACKSGQGRISRRKQRPFV